MDGGIAIGILLLVGFWVYSSSGTTRTPVTYVGQTGGTGVSAGSLLGTIGSLLSGANAYQNGGHGAGVTGSNNSYGPNGGQLPTNIPGVSDSTSYDGPNPDGSIGGVSNPPVVLAPDGGADGSDSTGITYA